MMPSHAPRTLSEIRQLVSSGRMSAHQLTAILVCVGLNMLDGFDVLVMSFTAPGVSADWKLSGSQVGLLISAGLVGMALGSLFLAPRADRYGRRAIVMVSVLIVSIGMLLSAVAQSSWQLAGLRALTGVGIGGSATVLVNEYSSSKWRNTASYLYTSGYSIGGTLGGFIAAGLIAKSGWRAAFEFGGIVSFAMLPISFWCLPESLDFLITRQPAGALNKLNRLLTGMQRPTVEVLPTETARGVPARASLRQLLSPELVRSTLLIWTAFFFMMGGYYFVFGWTPKLLASNGLTAQQGITSGVLLSLGGIFGTVIFAFVARVLEPRWLITFCLLVTYLARCIGGIARGGRLGRHVHHRHGGILRAHPGSLRAAPAHDGNGMGNRDRPHWSHSCTHGYGIAGGSRLACGGIVLAVCSDLFDCCIGTDCHGALAARESRYA
jgi:MFS family permease